VNVHKNATLTPAQRARRLWSTSAGDYPVARPAKGFVHGAVAGTSMQVDVCHRPFVAS
jgi:hypothetical protein